MYLLYHKQEGRYDTFLMKLNMNSMFLFRIGEIVFYIILYRILLKHNNEMQQNNIISQDLNRARRKVNLLSVYAHILGFVAENLYYVIALLWRMIGQTDTQSERSRENVAVLLIVQFAIVSTVPILASSELRPKFLALFKQ